MKKLLLTLSLFLICSLSFGQVIFSENFESGVFPPLNWTATVNNAAFTWVSNTVNPIGGATDISVQYDPAPAAQQSHHRAHIRKHHGH